MAPEQHRQQQEHAIGASDVLVVRGVRVMLDARVAVAFGTETKRVNEAVARNRVKFDQRHAFQLTEQEAQALRSQRATSTVGRGGARYRPHVFTLKGVARLATVLDTPAALAATDLVIDTFVMVQDAVRQGRRTVAVADPARYRRSASQRSAVRRLKARLAVAVGRLIDSMASAAGSEALVAATVEVGAGAIASVRERLRTKGLENAKLEADAALVLAQADKLLAEARKIQAEAEGLDIENFEKRVRAVRRVVELVRDLEPARMVDLIDGFNAAPLLIGGASVNDDETP